MWTADNFRNYQNETIFRSTKELPKPHQRGWKWTLSFASLRLSTDLGQSCGMFQKRGLPVSSKILSYDLQTWVSWDLEIRRALDKFPTRWSRSFMVGTLYWWSIFHHIYSFVLTCNLHLNWLFELVAHCCGHRVSIWNRSLRNLILNYG